MPCQGELFQAVWLRWLFWMVIVSLPRTARRGSLLRFWWPLVRLPRPYHKFHPCGFRIAPPFKHPVPRHSRFGSFVDASFRDPLPPHRSDPPRTSPVVCADIDRPASMAHTGPVRDTLSASAGSASDPRSPKKGRGRSPATRPWGGNFFRPMTRCVSN